MISKQFSAARGSAQFRAKGIGYPIQWAMDDQLAALSQGWGLFSTDGEGVQLQKYDEEDTFECDEDASKFVDALAAEGDELCIRAIAFLAMTKLHGG